MSRLSAITYSKFKETVRGAIEAHLGKAEQYIRERIVSPAPGSVFLFPSMLLFTKTDTHYAFELLGARREPEPLLVKQNRKGRSFNRIVGGFDPDDSTLYLIGTGNSQPTNVFLIKEGLTLTCDRHLAELAARFPGFDTLLPRSEFRSTGDMSSFMALDAQCFTTLALNQCMLTSNLGKVVRPKYANFLFGEATRVEEAELVDDLSRSLVLTPGRLLPGVQMAPANRWEAMYLAASFTNLYLQDVHETTVTQFLEAQGEVIQRAFSAQSVFYQKSLPWRDGNPNPDEEAIQPDIILCTHDGQWKIVEFKLPLLDQTALTVGARKRRGFNYSVSNAIEQLFNYEEYFHFEANCQAAAEVLGEAPIDPQLVLVIGSSENVDMTKINEAKRSRKPFDLIDYDSLMRLYLGPSSTDDVHWAQAAIRRTPK
jgi:hypothetical protein